MPFCSLPLASTDDAIRIVQEFVLGNGHLKLTSDQLAETMRDVDGNEHPDAIQFARMVLDVWRLRNPHLEGVFSSQPGITSALPPKKESIPLLPYRKLLFLHKLYVRFFTRVWCCKSPPPTTSNPLFVSGPRKYFFLPGVAYRRRWCVRKKSLFLSAFGTVACAC